MLPEEILRIIYKCVLDDGKQYKVLLDWRLVCSSWKNAVDNYYTLIDKFWWTVRDIPELLNSTIARKVNNLRFVCELLADHKQMELFFKEIIPSLERFMFEFPERSISQSNEVEVFQEGMLFNNVVSLAKNLKEIRVKSSNRQFLWLLNPEEIALVGSNVNNLYLNIKDVNEGETPILQCFLLSMSKLGKLVLVIFRCIVG